MTQFKPNIFIRTKSIVHKGEKRLLLIFPYNKALIQEIKSINGRRYSKSLNSWHLPENESSRKEVEQVNAANGKQNQPKSSNRILQKGSYFFFNIPVEAFALRKEIKTIIDWQWHNDKKEWSIPVNDSNRQLLRELGLEYVVRKSRELIFKNQEKKVVQKNKVEDKIESTKRIGRETIIKIEEYKRWMEQKRYSSSSINTYTSFIKLFFSKHLDKAWNEISLNDITEYNHRKFIQAGQSYSSQNQFINALKLFYKLHQNKGLNIENIERPRREKNLPGVLSKEEVQQIIGLVNNNKHKCLLAFVYGAGLRIGEALNLELSDIRKEEKLLYIRKAKGMKDRRVPLSGKMLLLFDIYRRTHLPKKYVFEGQKGGKYSATSAQQVFKRAVAKAGIKVPVTLHTLRHSYATHLMEAGVGLRYIQEVLGHSSPKTTMIYTHVSGQKLNEIRSPLEDMDI